jgi:hypothetical protein
MAIVYGSYGQALDNFVSVQSVGSTDTFYFTIPWYKASYIEHINIWNSTGTAMTIDAVYILNNSAHYRYNNTDKGHIMWVDFTDKVGRAAQGYFVNYSVDPVAFVENLYGRNYLEILVITTANISNAKMFCQAVGRKNINSNYELADRSGISNDRSYRVLMGKNQSGVGGTGGTCYDITGLMTGRGGENKSQAGFATTNDYLYVGSTKQLTHWEFRLSGYGQTNAALNMQYWNGRTWSSTGVTILDGTFSCVDTMRFSGIIENDGLAAMGSSWKATRMSGTGLSLLTDPNYTYVEAINAGTIQPATLAWDPARYWMRFSVSKVVGSGVSFSQILPISEEYEEQRYS